MKVRFDDISETTTINAIAYDESKPQDSPWIIAVVAALITVGISERTEEITDLSSAPNRADDYFDIKFDYFINVKLNVAGKIEIYNSTISASKWDAGMYMVRLQSHNGEKSQMININ